MATHTDLTLKTVRKDVNEVLDEFYETRLLCAQTMHPSYARLWEAMRATHQAGGKRLRPNLMLLAYQGYGGRDYKVVLPVAAALELLHNCLLMHDDIIDQDYVRHGAPNVAGRYQQTYGSYLTQADRTTHYANSAALLAGDLLLAGSYELIHTSRLTAERKARALSLLDEAVFVVGGGELLDTEAPFTGDDSADSLVVARLKTAQYSFVTPLTIGAVLAGAAEQDITHLRQAGEALGIAFQLTDDLLGIFGDEAVTGKSTKSDLREGKRTYLVERALELATKPEQERLLAVLGDPAITGADEQAVRDILIRCGAKAATEALVDEECEQALQKLEGAGLSTAARRGFTQLVHDLARRQA